MLDSIQLSSMISLELNHPSEIPHSIGGTRVSFPNYGPPNQCVIKEIIPETSRHDFDKPNDTATSFWASLDSVVDEEFNCDYECSSDSCISNSKVISKTTLVSFKPCFKNPSVGQSSNLTSDSKKKRWLNKKDIVHPKTEARKSLEKETMSRKCSRFL